MQVCVHGVAATGPSDLHRSQAENAYGFGNQFVCMVWHKWLQMQEWLYALGVVTDIQAVPAISKVLPQPSNILYSTI